MVDEMDIPTAVPKASIAVGIFISKSYHSLGRGKHNARMAVVPTTVSPVKFDSEPTPLW
jgi:hypothetical protein